MTTGEDDDVRTDDARYQAQLALEGHLLAEEAKRWPLEVFVPDERLLEATDEERGRWDRQVDELTQRGWTVQSTKDFVRLGVVLRLWPPPFDWGEGDAPLVKRLQEGPG